MGSRHITIDETAARSRLDQFIARQYPEYSRSALTKLIERGLVLVNNQDAKAGYRLREHDEVSVDISPLKQPEETIDLPIIYEDDDIIVIDKPSGVISHARGLFWNEPSVASFIREKVTKLTGQRAGIVHRLDRATSGVMVCAKNEATLSFLQKQFSERTIKKSYVALCHGHFKQEKAKIVAPIARNPKKPTTFMVSKFGKHAETIYEVVKQHDATSLVRFQPLTGRTHQLRVHAAFLGNPIVGDTFYGNDDSAKRLMLHAETIVLTMPNGKIKTLSAPLPEAFYEK